MKASSRFAGVGFVFTEKDDFAGIDLDHCRDPESGAIADWATVIIEKLHSYSEVSPSGTGVHIIVRGELPDGRRRKGNVEMYSAGRYFTVTGNRVPGAPVSVEHRTSELQALHGEVFGDSQAPASGSRSNRDFTGSNMGDQELIAEASESHDGGRFRKLWRGDWGDYASQSEADLALCSRLAHWTGLDAIRIDSLFRQSDLFRPKWDEPHFSNGRTYGQATVEKALASRNGSQNGVDGVAASGKATGAVQVESTPKLAALITSDSQFAQDAGGRLYVFQSGVYAPGGEEYVRRRVKALQVEHGREDKWTSHRANEVVEFIRVDSPSLWERPPTSTLNLGNGLLDVESGELRDHDPEFLSPIQLPVRYDPEAKCPYWQKFVEEVLPADTVDLGWSLIAWLALPDDSIQKAVLLLGPGGNGKSTLLGGFRAFLGARNVSSISLHRLESDRFSAARLVGKLANVCADLPSQHLDGTSMFKAITGGDLIQAEHKFRDSFDFRPFSKLVFSANHPPQSGDGSSAFFDRWLVVPCNRSFRGNSDEIPRGVLDASLADPVELSGVLNKALATFGDIRRRGGFFESASMKEAWSEFRSVTDPLVVWLDRHTVDNPEAMVPKHQLVAAFNTSAASEGRPSTTPNGFGRDLRRLRPGIRDAQRTVFGKLTWVWLGIGLIGSEAAS